MSAAGLRRLLVRAAGVVLLSCSAGALAAEDDNLDQGALSENSAPAVDQMAGFVVDRTVTNFGAQFFRYFSEAWRDQSGTEGVDVAVVEKPSARFGSMVFIEHNNRPVARVFLYAGRAAAIAPTAVQAANYVAGQVATEAVAAMMSNDPDLGKDELR